MENTPLGRAYDNAKNAVIYRDTGSLHAAKEAHQGAAVNYDSAAKSTTDFEAARLLTLLKAHHADLARALTVPANSKSTDQPAPIIDGEGPEHDMASADKVGVQGNLKNVALSTKTNPALATLSIRRQPRRDLSSSIVSNLATARGRPSSNSRVEALPSGNLAQHAGGKLSSRTCTQSHVNKQSTRRPESGTESGSSRPESVLEEIETEEESDTFSRFYNSLHGLYAKLPGSLAFTGLGVPVSIDPDTAGQGASQASKTGRATADPEYSTIFAPSTIRAVNKEIGPALANHESFYVVPPSGGTRSYAGMLSGRSGDAYDSREDEEEDGDKFVDARENVGQPTPITWRKFQGIGQRQKLGRGQSAKGKSMEELELESNALRQLVDAQSRRLQMWEASAQSQSMVLAQSMRLNRTTVAPERTAPQLESEQVKKLQEDLCTERTQRQAVEHHYEKMERENEKLLLQVANLRKYKDKWERLKESARQKQRQREGKVEGSDAVRLG